MRYLAQGLESRARLDLLLSLTRITSEAVREGLADHLVRGLPLSHAALINDVPKQNLARAYDQVNKVAEVVEKIKLIDTSSVK